MLVGSADVLVLVPPSWSPPLLVGAGVVEEEDGGGETEVYKGMDIGRGGSTSNHALQRSLVKYTV